MNDKKMIILNCPAFDSKYNECHSKIEPHKLYCMDCTDCVLKRIVELCKEESSIIQHKQRIKVKGLNKLADKIFELLDIIEETTNK